MLGSKAVEWARKTVNEEEERGSLVRAYAMAINPENADYYVDCDTEHLKVGNIVG